MSRPQTKVAVDWLHGFTPSSLERTRKRLLQADAELARGFRDMVIEYLLLNVVQVDPQNRAKPRAWQDGGGSCTIHVSALAGKHPQAIFPIKVPEDPFLLMGFGKAQVEIGEQRTGKKWVVDVSGYETYDEVARALIREMVQLLGDPEKDDQSGSAIPY